MLTMPLISLAVVVGLAVLGLVVLSAIFFRRVVSTNMVHIVQSGRKTTPYGSGLEKGNVYYQWPGWVPGIGVNVIKLPVSNFALSLNNYEAYDKDRVPFVVDVVAFFRIANTALAAQRVVSMDELEGQLLQIVQGAVRKILASDNIDTIMTERAKFGEAFTQDVFEQLKEWGVESVKSMELMDIRDSHESQVIHNIMAKKISHISMESRVEVAKNGQAAETAEIVARQAVSVRAQEAEEAIGKRTAEKDQAVGVANQLSNQQILTAQEQTQERQMAVTRVEQVRQAEITRDQQVVAAEQDKQTTVIIAEGNLEAQKREAQGIEALGAAKASAEKLMQLAPVEAQIVLAKEIGGNDGYQAYLVALKGVDGYVAVGTAQAEALKGADVKVIANAGDATTGVNNARELFSPQGGTAIGAMLEAMSNTPQGAAILKGIVARLSAKEPEPPLSPEPAAEPA